MLCTPLASDPLPSGPPRESKHKLRVNVPPALILSFTTPPESLSKAEICGTNQIQQVKIPQGLHSINLYPFLYDPGFKLHPI